MTNKRIIYIFQRKQIIITKKLVTVLEFWTPRCSSSPWESWVIPKGSLGGYYPPMKSRCNY